MDIQYKGDNLIEIDGRVRIEWGPRVVEGVIATAELLADAVTARHYSAPVNMPVYDKTPVVEFEGNKYYIRPDLADLRVGAEANRPFTPPNQWKPLMADGKPLVAPHYTLDAVGVPIRVGEPFTYVDWRSDWRRGGPDASHNVYVLENPVDPEADYEPRWVKKGIYPDEQSAMSAAVTLAAELAGTPAPADPVPPRTPR